MTDYTGTARGKHRTAQVKSIREWIRVIHRYLAFVLCLMCLIWFLSGFIMMYKDFPFVSMDDSLALRKPISSSEIQLLPHMAEIQSGMTASVSSARLGMVSDRLGYWFQDQQGQVQTVYADTAERMVVDPVLVRHIVSSDQKQAQSIQQMDQMTELDQWTPTADFLPHMPMYRVYMNDSQGTVLYVSSALQFQILPLPTGIYGTFCMGSIT